MPLKIPPRLLVEPIPGFACDPDEVSAVRYEEHFAGSTGCIWIHVKGGFVGALTPAKLDDYQRILGLVNERRT